MYSPQPPRVVSAASSLALVVLLAAILIAGLGTSPTKPGAEALVSIEIALPPPPTPPPDQPRPHRTAAQARGDPSPRNIENKATPVVAPPIAQPLTPPPPIVVAARADIAAAPDTGASTRPGPGQGAGGNGSGPGGGGLGGDGDGDDNVELPPRPVVDRLRYRDLPEGMLAQGQRAVVEVLFEIEPNGRVTHCRIAEPSGYPAIDGLTCRLIEQRYRYKPARDSNGRAVQVTMSKREGWYNDAR